MEKVPNWSVIIFKKENNNLQYSSVFSKIDNILWKFDKSKYISNKKSIWWLNYLGKKTKIQNFLHGDMNNQQRHL